MPTSSGNEDLMKLSSMKPEIEQGCEFVWLIDDSLKRCEYKLEQFIETSIGNNGVVQSSSVKMAHRQLNRPVSNLAPKIYCGVSEV